MNDSAPNGSPQGGKFRRRATVVEARRLTQDNLSDLIEWTGGKHWSRPPMRAVTGISFPHPVADGDQIAEFGDWVVQLGDGNFRVWNDDHFQEAYEAVVERDPAAELADNLKAVIEAYDADPGSTYDPHDGIQDFYPPLDNAIEAARAALAAYEASRK